MKKSVFSASAIIAGNGIGSGVMAIPYFISRAGIIGGITAFAVSYLVSVLLHLMIAEIMLQTNDTEDILGAFNNYLFKGRFKNVLRISFFVIMVVVLETTLAGYISGASSILTELFPNLNAEPVFKTAFYLIAAVTVLLGLRAICISEKVSVSVMGAILAIAIVLSFMNINPDVSIGWLGGNLEVWAATFSMIMFSFSAIFAVPQVIECLDHDKDKVRKSVFIGFLINLIISVIVVVCTIITSCEVTKVAIVGWAEAVGGVIRVLGCIFILFAMFTSYWSIGFATTEIISNQTQKTFGLSFALATVPALIMTFLLPGGFMEYMKMAGGAVAVIISLMLIPTYLICTKGRDLCIMRKFEASKVTVAFVFVMYIVMAVGSLITV